MMEKCLQNIKENECDIEYFENKQQVSKVPITVIQEYSDNVKQLSQEFSKIEEVLQEKLEKSNSIDGGINLLKEQLLSSTGEAYDIESRTHGILQITQQIEQNNSKIKLNKKQMKDLTQKIKDVEEQVKNLDKECALLSTYIQDKEIKEFEVDTSNLLESEIYTYNKICAERKMIDKSVQKIQTKFSDYIEYIK